jgi:predicted PurR-regulated permease PerM
LGHGVARAVPRVANTAGKQEPALADPAPSGHQDDWRLFRHALIVMAAIGIAVMTWQLAELLILLFASILASLMFHDLAMTLKRRMKLRFSVALALAVLLPLSIIAMVFGLFGNLMYGQFETLSEQLPAVLKSAEAWLSRSEAGVAAIAAIKGYAPEVDTVMSFAQATIANLGFVATAVAVILVGGVYFAAQPDLYLGAIRSLVPHQGQPRLERTLVALHTAVTGWLKGQAVGMVFVAIGTSIGLAVAGIPSALAIGLVAGLCEFVPYLGVIIVTVPAVAIGFSISAQTGILTIIALVVVQQIQGNLVTPLAQGKLADLPPALTIFSLIGAGVLLGPLGVIFAVPLTIVILVLLKSAVAVGHEPGGPLA